LATITKVSICGDDFRKLVSSANRFIKKDVAKVKSFIYMRNSRGPRTLPWEIVFSLEKIPFIHQLKNRSTRVFLKEQSKAFFKPKNSQFKFWLGFIKVFVDFMHYM